MPVLRASLLVLVSIVLGSCGTASPSGRRSVVEARPRTPAQAYLAALEDAAIPEPEEISNDLWALTRVTPDLVWESASPSARVKVATILSESTFQRYYAEEPPERTAPPAWGIIWVTPVPQLRAFCSKIAATGTERVDRVKQWLGLKPTATYDRVVELWVAPNQLARPCPDPEVTDTRCGLKVERSSLDPDYYEWFVNQFASSYTADGFPWTRLGYTYDWAPSGDGLNPTKPIGGSEYILRPGASYTIADGYSIQEYCGAKLSAG